MDPNDAALKQLAQSRLNSQGGRPPMSTEAGLIPGAMMGPQGASPSMGQPPQGAGQMPPSQFNPNQMAPGQQPPPQMGGGMPPMGPSMKPPAAPMMGSAPKPPQVNPLAPRAPGAPAAPSMPQSNIPAPALGTPALGNAGALSGSGMFPGGLQNPNVNQLAMRPGQNMGQTGQGAGELAPQAPGRPFRR